MAHIYRETDPVSGRWTGNSGGIDLSAFQIDQNFYQILQAIATIQSSLTATVSISYITQTANTFTFHMTDSTLQGPFTIPQSTFTDRGTWAPLTAYAVNDTFNINGTLYLVIFAHTSASTFSAGANDGLGHNYYSAMLSVPGSALPTGGATAQVLQKSSGTDFAVTWGYKLPIGGTAGQVLLKQSSTNQDTNWGTLDATMVSFHGSTASGLTATNVAAALEEIEANIGGAGIALHSLSDVSVTEGSGINGYSLTWNNTTSKWVASAPTLSGLTDVNVTEGAGIDGYFLKWSNSTGKWIAAASTLTSLSGLTDVNVTEGPGINGYFLTWNNSTGKWVAAAASNNLTGLADVNVTEGAGIDGFFLKWNNATSRWIAAASSSSLSGLSDVNVTEGSGIDGYSLKWSNATSKWIASTSSLSGLADVNVTEGAGINGYLLKYDNASGKWVASLSGATGAALSGLTDVNVSEGSGIDGYFLKWNNSTSKWVAGQAQAYDAQLFSNIPQNSKSAAYTTVLTDAQKHIFHPSADTTARTFTIDSNANVAYPIGTAITFVNQNGAGVVTIAITSDTMRLAGAGTTGSRTLAANGVATALKITSTEWIISGTGLT